MRIGFGYDVHPLVAGRRLVLGGVEIKHDFGLAGHSDADVLCHAIGDALLGAANFGDLGKHFPDTSAKFANINSLLLLKEIAQLLQKNNYRVINIDSTLVLEAPKVMPFAEQMRSNIAEALALRRYKFPLKPRPRRSSDLLEGKKARPRLRWYCWIMMMNKKCNK
jgi:2-C-methyl-D-erythritol 2,4-cyclodiphosphate synthase